MTNLPLLKFSIPPCNYKVLQKKITINRHLTAFPIKSYKSKQGILSLFVKILKKTECCCNVKPTVFWMGSLSPNILKKQPPEVLYKKAVLKNFAIFTTAILKNICFWFWLGWAKMLYPLALEIYISLTWNLVQSLIQIKAFKKCPKDLSIVRILLTSALFSR